MKICNIVPLKYTLLSYTNSPTTMLLCHLSKENEEYKKIAKNSHNYKMMDNSIIELGSAFSLENLIKEAIECDVNEIILPDSFQNAKETIRLAKQSITWLKKKKLLHKFKLQCVCHGKTIDEFKWCFNKINKINEIDVIGIPKVLTKTFGNRCELWDIFKNTGKQIHLLGCWDSFNELTVLPDEAFIKIRSLDTCLISLLSNYGDDVFNTKRPDKTIDFYNTEINEKNFIKMKNQIDKYCEKYNKK